ncbi:MAG: TetR/AcrR family transcriptional regulator [Microbacteriaceae bacterium]
MSNVIRSPKATATRSRLLTYAIREFARGEFHSVSIAEIAREAGLTPQAVYRYFKGKDDLYRAAIEFDVQTIQKTVLAEVADHPLPILTGELWRVYSRHVDNHPLAKMIITSRNHEKLSFISGLPSSQEIFQKVSRELTEAQRHGVIRDDIDVEMTMESAQYIFSFVSLPLLYEGKLNTNEWLRVTYLFTSSIFYPMPDLQKPGGLDEINAKMATLAQTMSS